MAYLAPSAVMGFSVSMVMASEWARSVGIRTAVQLQHSHKDRVVSTYHDLQVDYSDRHTMCFDGRWTAYVRKR